MSNTHYVGNRELVAGARNPTDASRHEDHPDDEKKPDEKPLHVTTVEELQSAGQTGETLPTEETKPRTRRER